MDMGIYGWESQQGLFKYSFENNSLENCTPDLNLKAPIIYDIQGDEQGNLWLSSDYGLIRFNSKEESRRKTKIISIKDGAPFEEIYTYKIYIGKSGNLYAGGKRGSKNGFYRFKPENLEDNTNIPPIVLTGFFIRNEAIELDTSIVEKKHISLIYHPELFHIRICRIGLC